MGRAGRVHATNQAPQRVGTLRRDAQSFVRCQFRQSPAEQVQVFAAGNPFSDEEAAAE